MLRRFTLLSITLGLLAGSAPSRAADWHHPLYLPGDGYWHSRIRVTAANQSDQAVEGQPVTVRVGQGPGEADLAGQAVERLRACNESGVELLFGVAGPDGMPLESGPIPARASLTLPVVCPARGSAACYVYFDNPSAGAVPDFLNARTSVVNGDVELGDGPAPTGWRHDPPDPQHTASWSDENSQSGRRSLKTVVAEGAEPTWISTRQSGIQIAPGAKYQVRAWVKARNVRGRAGWYLHVGNAKQPMMLSPMLLAGEGTFDWRPVEARFTAPADADRLDLGTVLRGTGTAWFDNVTLTRLDGGHLTAKAERPERLLLREEGADPAWLGPADHRAVVRAFNFADADSSAHTIHVDLATIERRMRGRLNPESLAVTFAGRSMPCVLAGRMLGIEAALPARTARTYYVYFSDDPRARAPGTPQRPARSEGNLLRNGSFERGEPMPDAWTTAGQAPGVRFSLDDTAAPGEGRRSARMEVGADVPPQWRGWHQTAAVRGGACYLLAGWLKCHDAAGDVALHIHFHDAAGRLCKQDGMTAVGPSLHGTSDWTLLSGLLTAPRDAAKLSLHLTMLRSGSVWHDGLSLREVRPAEIAGFQGRPLAGDEPLRAWPVNPIVKIFPDEPAPANAPAEASACLARGEKEPLQIALRSARPVDGVRAQVTPLEGPGGAKLADVAVNVVGFVPIDHPTSYFQSDTPTWERKFPVRGGQCDGWAGLWPDPLLPDAAFRLAPNQTAAVWLTVGADAQTPPGEYRGALRLVSAGQTLAQVPLRVRVWGFALPEERNLAAIYDIRCKPADLWGGTNAELYRSVAEFMHQRRLCPDSVQPWPSLAYRDGRAVADFTEFDRAAEWYFGQMKFPRSYMPWHFYLFGWGHPPANKFGELPYAGQPPFEGADRSKLRPEFKRAYQACLKAFWEHVTAKGWQDRFVLYISDEPYDRHEHIRAQMKALCAMIHEVDPKIPVYSSTWHHVPDWDGSLNVWGISHYGQVPVEKMAELRARGARIWFTTDGQMCTDTPYCAVERLLPHYCFKYQAEAYEFWGLTWLTYDPFRFGWHAYIHQSGEPGKSTWVRYPNGDGFLLYPGKPIGQAGFVSSIRLEQAREGVEDFEYLHMLRQLAARAKAAGRATGRADEVLAEADRLVEIPNAGGRYSSKILPDPEAVLRWKWAAGAAIEALAGGRK